MCALVLQETYSEFFAVYSDLRMEMNGSELPSLEDYKKNRADERVMNIFCTHFLACVVGKQEFRKKRLMAKV